MKVLPFEIPKPGSEGLVYQEDQERVFYNQLHQHREIQLSYIVRGSGTLIVSDSINSFNSGDLFVIGSNVPHVFRSDETATEQSLMKSLFFHRDSFGPDFFELEETSELFHFFERSRTGIQILSRKEVIQRIFNSLGRATGLERLIALLQILNELNKSEYQSLSSVLQDIQLSRREGQRLRDVFNFTASHYDSQITLDQVATVANMTKTAFCKYFKKRTNKTYIQFLNEYRIEMFIRLKKMHTEASISQLAYDQGFGSISNFNKTFKRTKGVSPGTYFKEKRYMEKQRGLGP